MAQAQLVTSIIKDAQVEATRVPPQSVEAEQSVLGGLLLDNIAWDRVADLVTEQDFYRADHRLIYQHIGQLIEHGKPADALKKHDLEVPRAAIRMPQGPLKQVGDHPIKIALHADVVVTVTVSVLGEQ